MGNEIFAIILWLVSIPVAWVIAYILLVTVVVKAVDRLADGVPENLWDVVKGFWPAILLWGAYAIWVIIAVVNAIVHLFLAIQIGTGAIPGA